MMNTGIATADYLIICGFFAVMLGIGYHFGKRVKSMSQFFGGGKQVPWWLGGVSFYMVSFSALAFVMHSELVYKYGIISLVLGWLPVPAAIFSAVLFARRWRRVAQTSPLEYIEARYGSGMRQGLLWLGLPTRLLDDAIKLFAIGTLVSVGLGFPFEQSIIACSLIILGYTFMGGLMAALVADFVQLAVIVAAVAIMPTLAFKHAGGVGAVMDKLPENFWSIVRGDVGYPASYLLCYFLLLFLNYSTSWALVQRYYSTKDDKSAVKVGLLVAGLYVVGVPLFYAPAFAAVAFLPELASTKDVYPMICKTVLPVGMLGMVIAAMFSATMSTLAGDCNAMSSVLTNDFYKRYINKGSSDKYLLIIGRINTVIVGIIILGITLVMRSLQESKDLFDTMAKVFGVFLPPVAIPMLMGMLTPKVSSTGGKCALFGGIVSGLLLFIIGATVPWFRTAQALTFITSGMTLLGLALGSFLHPDTGERKQRVETFFERFAKPVDSAGQDAAAKESGISSFLPVIAGGIASMGVILVLSVLLTAGFTKGVLSIYIGTALIMVAFGLWISSRWKRKESA
jgi:SSS family transporter